MFVTLRNEAASHPKRLNVGGQRFLTTDDTYVRCTRLSQETRVKGDEAFIDRDGETFAHALAHLRGRALPPTLSAREEAALLEEADHFQLPTLRQEIQDAALWRKLRADEGDHQDCNKAKNYYITAQELLREGSNIGAEVLARALRFDHKGSRFRECYLDDGVPVFALEDARAFEQHAPTYRAQDSKGRFEEVLAKYAVAAYEAGRNDLTATEWRRVAFHFFPSFQEDKLDFDGPDLNVPDSEKEATTALWEGLQARVEASGIDSVARPLVALMLAALQDDMAAAWSHIEEALRFEPRNVALRLLAQVACKTSHDYDASARSYADWAAHHPVIDPMLYVAQVRLLEATEAQDATKRAEALEKARAAYAQWSETTQARSAAVEKALAYFD